ncbi:helix-turn-helix transcriptional regulator [Stieleria marina]|uniref:helix-turn-helix transcriptional regulator n=1 Tax=Stieleria marina TaxID=1930275 RepID=UPI003AF3D860
MQQFLANATYDRICEGISVEALDGTALYVTAEFVEPLQMIAFAIYDAPIEGIHEREWEIVRLLAEGDSQAEISEKVGITSSTIRTYLGRAREVVGCKTNEQMIAVLSKTNTLASSPNKT